MDGELKSVTARELWEEVIPFSEGQCRVWQIGQIRFWVRRAHEEWFIANEPTTEYLRRPVAGLEADPPEGLAWNRYVAGKLAKIIVRPALPDRPIVIKPSSPVKILSGKGSRYFIHLPVWVSIMEGAAKNRTLLSEQPGEPLSSTWFGNPDDGELCYSFTSELYKTPEERADLPLMAVCPLSIRNGSPGTLDFQRICVRVPHLHLYSGSRFLCTNELELVYRGVDQSQIDFQEAVPPIEPNLRHLTPPRVPASRNVIKKSFEYFRSLSLY